MNDMPPGLSLRIPGVCCAICHSPDLVAISPGDAEDRPLELFIIDRGEPMRAWCWDHWPVREVRDA